MADGLIELPEFIEKEIKEEKIVIEGPLSEIYKDLLNKYFSDSNKVKKNKKSFTFESIDINKVDSNTACICIIDKFNIDPERVKYLSSNLKEKFTLLSYIDTFNKSSKRKLFDYSTERLELEIYCNNNHSNTFRGVL